MCKQYGCGNAHLWVWNTVCTYAVEILTLLAHTVDSVERRWTRPAPPHGVLPRWRPGAVVDDGRGRSQLMNTCKKAVARDWASQSVIRCERRRENAVEVKKCAPSTHL
jgi:hypothetical protein